MAFEKFQPGDDGPDMSRFVGPGYVDQQLRQALNICWMSVPEERPTADAVEAEFRRIVERVLRDFRDDADHFGHPTE